MCRDSCRPELRTLLWLVAATAVARLATLAFTPLVNPDSCRYINAAHEFLSGNLALGFSLAGSLPTYPWLLIAVHALVPDWILAGQLLSTGCLILAVIPLYQLTRDLFGPGAALWSGLFFVISPELNNYAGGIIREPPFLLTFLWVIYFARRFIVDARWQDLLWVTALSLVAISLRFEMVVFYLVFPLMLLRLAWSDRPRRMRWLGGGAVFVVIPAILLLGFLLLPIGHSFDVRLGGGVNAFLGNLLEFKLLGTYPEVYARLSAIEPTFPGAQFAHDAIETTRHLLPLIYLLGLLDALLASLFPLFFGLAVWGIFRSPRERGNGSGALLFLTGAFLLAGYFALTTRNFISDRYLLAPMLLLLPWAGWGMHTLLGYLDTLGSLGWKWAAAILLVVVPAVNTAAGWDSGVGSQAAAGRWLQENHTKASTRLLVNDDRIALYAGYWMSEYAQLPEAAFDRLEQVALENKATLLGIRTSRKAPVTVPPMSRFRLIKSFEDHRYRIDYYHSVE